MPFAPPESLSYSTLVTDIRKLEGVIGGDMDIHKWVLHDRPDICVHHVAISKDHDIDLGYDEILARTAASRVGRIAIYGGIMSIEEACKRKTTFEAAINNLPKFTFLGNTTVTIVPNPKFL